MGPSGNVFERLFARGGLPSALFEDSKNLATSQKRPEGEMRREPQHSSIPLPRFQSGGGLLNHTGGTYSHSGMIDYPRFPMSELHFGKFLDTVEFQSWKVNFKTEVC